MFRNILISTLFLVLFAMIGTGIVAFVHHATAQRIANNNRAALLGQLNALVPDDRYDNDLSTDTMWLEAQTVGAAGPVTVYRARHTGQPVAAIFSFATPDGYSGPIRLLVGIFNDGKLAGVRVVGHNETPGLGDGIEAERSDWILNFNGLSLDNPPAERWAVRRDGGVFDQFTGATITPRAVVAAIKRSLLYFRDHRSDLFITTSAEETMP